MGQNLTWPQTQLQLNTGSNDTLQYIIPLPCPKVFDTVLQLSRNL